MISLHALMVHLEMMDSMILLHVLMSVMVAKVEKTCLAALIVEQSHWDMTML